MKDQLIKSYTIGCTIPARFSTVSKVTEKNIRNKLTMINAPSIFDVTEFLLANMAPICLQKHSRKYLIG